MQNKSRKNIKKIAVFASGQGTNFQSLAAAAKNGRFAGEISLVVSNKKDSGVLERARKEGICGVVLSPKNFKDLSSYDKALADLCLKHEIDLICLAGFLLKLGPGILSAFKNRIMNIHPALLPAFGGKGMYGMRVHEAVIKSGVRVSGATVHFVNENYDSGAIILQKAVPVKRGDTPKTLAERVLKTEHYIYPKAVELFCENRLKVKRGRVVLLPAGAAKIKRAIISVSDKTRVVEFARELSRSRVEIISTSGTYELLKRSGIPAVPLESVTGFPEILGGRVKTLNPYIHGAILCERSSEEHLSDLLELGIDAVDIVAVNLYPFSKVAESEEPWSDRLMENIDIGGVTLLRAAAKNYKNVAVVTDSEDYEKIVGEIRTNGKICLQTRRRLALKAFEHTLEYERVICSKLSGGDKNVFPQVLDMRLEKVSELRYGENPHQKSAFYSKSTALPFVQIQGKELSYNNILDAYGSWRAVLEFKETAAVVFKHVTPCGIATGENLRRALEKAWNSDPLSAFGGIIAVNGKLDAEMAGFISKKFVEVLCAPDFSSDALEILARKKNLRLLKWREKKNFCLSLKSAGDEVLIQEEDNKLFSGKWDVLTKRKPDEREEKALKFAWACAKHVRSNAIVLTDESRTVGIGAGQMSRVDASFIAARKYSQFLKNNPKPEVLVMASDAFFPFADAVKEAVKAGVTAIIQPGGSIRDREVVEAADKLNVSMVFTGMRHFRH